MSQVHIAYLPCCSNQPMLPERIQALVKTCSRQLQIQERLTQEIADGVDSLTGAGHMQACPLTSHWQDVCSLINYLPAEKVLVLSASYDCHDAVSHQQLPDHASLIAVVDNV